MMMVQYDEVVAAVAADTMKTTTDICPRSSYRANDFLDRAPVAVDHCFHNHLDFSVWQRVLVAAAAVMVAVCVTTASDSCQFRDDDSDGIFLRRVD